MSESSNGDQSAFPIIGSSILRERPGLTKRELLSAFALQGIVSAYGRDIYERDLHDVCRRAVKLADGLLAQLG